MVQREVAERFVADPGSKQYGAVSVKIAYWATARLVGIVPASVFVPRPNVESALVEIVRHRPPATDPDALFSLVRTAFGQRRKMLRRSLAERVSPEQFAAAAIAPEARPEATRHRRLVPSHRGGVELTIELVAPAKLTLSLRITGRRDDGYHLIDAEMVSLDLHDTVVIDPRRVGLHGRRPVRDRCARRCVEPRRTRAGARRPSRPRHDRKADPARRWPGRGIVRRRGGAPLGWRHRSGGRGRHRRRRRVLSRRRACPGARDR